MRSGSGPALAPVSWVDHGDDAADGGLGVPQLRVGDGDAARPVLDMGFLPAADHDVRAETVRWQRLGAALGQLLFQQVQGGLGEQVDSAAIGVTGGARRQAGRYPVVLGRHAHQPARRAEERR